MLTMIWRKYEPTLGEILSDSGTRALMRADGVRRRDLEAMFSEIARGLPNSEYRWNCSRAQVGAR
jgi:hypothetical protein